MSVQDYGGSNDQKEVDIEDSTAAVALQAFLAQASAQFHRMAQGLGQ